MGDKAQPPPASNAHGLAHSLPLGPLPAAATCLPPHARHMLHRRHPALCNATHCQGVYGERTRDHPRKRARYGVQLPQAPQKPWPQQHVHAAVHRTACQDDKAPAARSAALVPPCMPAQCKRPAGGPRTMLAARTRRRRGCLATAHVTARVRVCTQTHRGPTTSQRMAPARWAANMATLPSLPNAV